MAYDDVVAAIQSLARYREWTCGQCGHRQRAYAPIIQGQCERCGAYTKFRRFTGGADIEDVISEVLVWLGTGDDFERAMEWKRMLDAARDEEDAEDPLEDR